MSRCPYRVDDSVWCTYGISRTGSEAFRSIGAVIRVTRMKDIEGTWEVVCEVPFRDTVVYRVNEYGDDKGIDLGK
jgi:hypothetical protein